MEREKLKAIIRGEAAKREALADVEGRIDNLESQLPPLVAKRAELSADLARIDEAKATLDTLADMSPIN